MKYMIEVLAPDSEEPLAICGACDVNENGDSCGTRSKGAIGLHAERWTGLTPHGLPPSAESGEGLNDLGDVVGETGDGHAYLFTQGQLVDLGAALGGSPGDETYAVDLNNDRVVVGATHLNTKPRPYIYQSQTNAPPLLLDPVGGDDRGVAMSVNQSGDVAGWSQTSDWTQEGHGFVWRSATEAVEDLGQVWQLMSLSDSGLATGTKHFSGATTFGAYRNGNAFRLNVNADPPTFEDLGHSQLAGYVTSWGMGVNADGVVVGYSAPDYDAGSTQHWSAFVHFPDVGFHDLQGLVEDASDWELEAAYAINNNGVIVGSGLYQGTERGFRLTPDDSIDFPLKLGEYLEGFVRMVGGGSSGGGGIGLTYGFKPHPIPPHEPFIRIWRRLTLAQRDIAIAAAIDRLGSEMSDHANRQVIKRATSEVIGLAVREIEKEAEQDKP